MRILIQTTILSATLAAVNAAEIKLADCPPAVRATIEENQRDGRLDEVEMYQIDGKTVTYHVEIDRKGAPDVDLKIAESGKVLRESEDANA